MRLCAACCATLDGTTKVPAHSEKPDPAPVDFPCGHGVCGSCIRKRRRLAQACVLCETANDMLAGRSASSSAALPPSRVASRPASPPLYSDAQDEGEFVLGGDSDDEAEAPISGYSTHTPPPLEADPAFVVVGMGDPQDAPPAYEAGGVDVPGADGKEAREQCALHHVRPKDTLVGLALHYGVEGHVLCQLNKLPTSTLSTTPHLLHGKPFLLLPPTARRPSSSSSPVLPAPLERKRLVVRRFQVATKCADWATAQAYVNQVWRAREQEAQFVAENRRARGHLDSDVEVEVREGGELEEAVRAYEADERWEREQRNVKGKGPLPSRSVSQPGRGWSWKI